MEVIQGKLFDDSAFIKNITFGQCFNLSKTIYAKTIGADIVPIQFELDDMLTQNEKKAFCRVFIQDGYHRIGCLDFVAHD